MYKNFNINIQLLLSEPNINVTINASKTDDLNNVQLNNWLQSNVGNFKEIVNLGANKVAWSLKAYLALQDYYTFWNCFSNLASLLEVSELTSSYYGDLFLGYFFTVLGSFKTILQTFRNVTGYYTIEKVQKYNIEKVQL